MGVLPAGAYANSTYLEGKVSFADHVARETRDLAFDPQTSGGLLLAVDPAEASALEKELQSAGLPAKIVGEIVSRTETEITVTY